MNLDLDVVEVLFLGDDGMVVELVNCVKVGLIYVVVMDVVIVEFVLE